MPSKRAREQQAARPTRQAQLAEYPYCEPKAAGMDGGCYPRGAGGLTVHEPWTRGRGGPLGDRRNMVTACRWHNEELTQNQQAWAEANGYLVSATEGPGWLEAGGFKR